jgi:glucose/mannose-6-phosphate isomerase
MNKFEIDFNRQFQDGANCAKGISVKSSSDRVIFCGMGGSAIPGEIISMLWLDGFNCYLNRDYGLPHWVDKHCLVVCTSWSGNTEETISSFNEAINRGLSVVAVADKGELLELAKKHGTPSVDLPSRPEPARFVVGQMLSTILTLLCNSAIIEYNLTNSTDFQPVSADFSSRIGGKIPLIYSSYQWRYLARFWKIHFNENCKIQAFSNFLPEAAHNEISGFAQKDLCFPIILIDPDEEKADIKKLEKFATFLKNQNIDHEVVRIVGENRLEKILKNYNYAVSVSVGLAKLKNIEPFDTSVIEEFKKS